MMVSFEMIASDVKKEESHGKLEIKNRRKPQVFLAVLIEDGTDRDGKEANLSS